MERGLTELVISGVLFCIAAIAFKVEDTSKSHIAGFSLFSIGGGFAAIVLLVAGIADMVGGPWS